MQCKTTPSMLWDFRYAVLGGKSAVTGAPLPKKLEDCAVGVQEDHYAQACYVFASHNLGRLEDAMHGDTLLLIVEVPRGVTAERAKELRAAAVRQHLADHGFYG